MQIDERALKAAMQKMGIKQQEVNASEVIIKCPGREIVVKSPKVLKVSMSGKESFQVEGQVTERTPENEEDIRVVMEKTEASREQAMEALKSTKGDIAEAIIMLQEE